MNAHGSTSARTLSRPALLFLCLALVLLLVLVVLPIAGLPAAFCLAFLAAAAGRAALLQPATSGSARARISVRAPPLH